jgi:hypothetical protein
MNHRWKVAIGCFLALALLSMLCLGCGEKVEKENVIVIGHITDLTGPASTALIPLKYSLDDLVRYYNENNLIPGVKLRVVTYDTRYDPSRNIPAYEWCVERGAKLITTPLAETAETLKYFADRDHIPIACLGSTESLIEAGGWVFCQEPPVGYSIKGLLKWLSEEYWDYEAQGRKPKVGCVGWQESSHIDTSEALESYCVAHPDKFEYVGSYVVPMGVMTWAGEIEALKDCDFLHPPSTGMGTATFIRDFRLRGYEATFIGSSALCAFYGLLIDACGWEALDGTLTADSRGFIEDDSVTELTRELLYMYHPDNAADIEYQGVGYAGGFAQHYFFLDILRTAVENVGAENFDTQAYYDTAISFATTYEGCPEYSFVGYGMVNKRYARHYEKIYEWRAELGDMVSITDWQPVIEE